MNIIFKLGFKWHYRFVMVCGVILSAISAGLFFSSSFQNMMKSIISDHLTANTTISLIGFYTLSIVIIIVMALMIQCPKCHYKMFIHWFNESRKHKGMGNPYMLEECPKCGYDPEDKKQ